MPDFIHAGYLLKQKTLSNTALTNLVINYRITQLQKNTEQQMFPPATANVGVICVTAAFDCNLCYS